MKTYLRGVFDVYSSYFRIARLVPSGGAGLVTLLLALNLVLGLLPIVFILATSIMIGRVPAAVVGGVGSAEWRDLVAAFVVAAAAFLVQQILAPMQESFGELLARRVDGRVYQRLIGASLSSTGIGPLEDQRLLDDLTQVLTTLEQGFRTPGLACAGLVALMARYTQLLAAVFVVGYVFSWPAALALFAVTMAFRRGNRGGLRTYGRRSW